MQSVRTYLKFLGRGVFGFFSKQSQSAHAVLNIEGADVFFGYYGREVSRNDRIIVTVVENKSISLNVLEVESKKTLYSKELEVTNYQQANQQQWFDDDIFGYVDRSHAGHLTTHIHDISSGKSLIIPLSLQIKIAKNQFISIDYSKFSLNAPDYSYDSLAKSEDGVQLVTFRRDLSGYHVVKLFADLDVSLFLGVDHVEKFHLNHFMISPCGEKLLFIARYTKNGKRVDRLISFSLRDKSFKLCLDSNYVSHYCFTCTSKVLFFGKSNSASKRGYFIVDLDNNSTTAFGPAENINVDGHPIIANGVVVSDTYPDLRNYQHLLVFHKDKMLRHRFYHPNFLDPSHRCDLHPVFDGGRMKIFFNHFHDGCRAVGWIDLAHD